MATDLEREIRDMLSDRAATVRTRTDAPPTMFRRARRRRIGTALVSSVVVAGVVAVAAVGTRALLTPTAAPRDIRPAGPEAEQFAVWPQTTREEAEAAQECVESGNSECTWQLNALEVARRYGEQELGWENVFAFVEGFSDEYLLLPIREEDDIGLAEVVEPLTVRIAECLPPQIQQPECEGAQLSVEKPLRPDVTGIWLITKAQHGTYEVPESPPPHDGSAATHELPDPVLDFLQRFMDLRHSGDGAEPFLFEEAPQQFERGDGGLSLYGYAQDGVPEVVGGEPVPNDGPLSYRVRVAFHVGDSTITESLLVEERPDGVELGPRWRDFRVTSAERTS